MKVSLRWRCRSRRGLGWMPGRIRSNVRGASFVGVLVALLALLVLVMGYVRLHTPGERARGVTAVDTSRGVACRVQRQQIERDILVWLADHPDEAPSIPALESAGLRVPACPEGGRYTVAGRAVVCSVHH